MKVAQTLRTYLMKKPFLDLKLIVKDTSNYMKQAQLSLIASSLAYTTILSIIPLLAVSFALFQAFGGLKSLGDTVEPFIVSNLAEGVSDDVLAKIHGFVGNTHANVIGAGGLIALIFTSMSMLSNIEKGINRVWHAPINRSWYQRISTYWLFLTLGPIALAMLIGGLTSLKLPFFPEWLATTFITFIILAATYKWVPNVKVNTRCALTGGILIAIVFGFAQSGFQLYATTILSYNKIYGGLAAVPILLLWIQILWILVLSGAAFTAAMQKRIEIKNLPASEKIGDDHDRRPLSTRPTTEPRRFT